MTTRDILIILLVIVVLAHLFGLHWHIGGPIGLVLLILLILVLLGKV